LPNVLVTDLDYSAADDILVAGTFGRGAWAVKNAKASLGVPAVLRVSGTNNPDLIRLVRNADNPSLLDVYVGDRYSPLPAAQQFQLSTLQEITIDGLGGNDLVVIDVSNGLIGVPDGIGIDGGLGQDILSLEKSPETKGLYEAYRDDAATTGGTGVSQIKGGGAVQTVSFARLEQNTPLSNVTPVEGTIASLIDGLKHAVELPISDAIEAAGAFPGLGNSLGRALDGVSVVTIQPIATPITGRRSPAVRAFKTSLGDDTHILRRLLESGLGPSLDGLRPGSAPKAALLDGSCPATSRLRGDGSRLTCVVKPGRRRSTSRHSEGPLTWRGRSTFAPTSTCISSSAWMQTGFSLTRIAIPSQRSA
jgi:hypothetical protein